MSEPTNIPTVIVEICGGIVQEVTVTNGRAHVIVKDYDIQDAEPDDLIFDAEGHLYLCVFDFIGGEP